MNRIEKINKDIIDVRKQLQIVEMTFEEESKVFTSFKMHTERKRKQLMNRLDALLERLHNYTSPEGDYMLKRYSR